MLIYQINLVVKARRKSNIQYPRAYAEKAEIEASPEAMAFNCAQRAHQNTLENIPMIYTSTLITSIKYPVFSSAMLTIWSLSRVAYAAGYSSGNPQKRMNFLSTLHYPTILGLAVSATWTVGQLILADLS
ncbi:unnamed protein product [Mycena citricolor]|uniref:Uncharacterized protein n=1 Tax=Mycena citricolor TaxID=2018698 RepID=A0AAD2HLZ4_9AGAR|nr:unnamed protein product [Mycena citricolor]